MTQDEWRQIEELYHAARECDPTQRAALLESTDPDLRSRVERMLEVESGSGILDPAPDREFTDFNQIEVLPGAQLGPYEIEAQVGAGGMGTVYRALDLRLGRTVAIKVAAEGYSERFQREARAISTLNHPHICTLYDVGPNYLVMEFIEGSTLADEIKQPTLALERAARYGAQIADALAEAHSVGIVHRDLKPSNIMLTRQHAKILDFGLAKFRTDQPAPDETTVTSDHELTNPGSTMGTAAYMSPEQVRAQPLDTRTDLFSFGVVLYEMAAGEAPFRGRSLGEVFGAILHQTPAPVSQLNPAVPPELAPIIARCLEKDRELRYRHASEIRADLQGISQGRLPAVPGKGPRRALTAAGALIALAAVGAGSYFYFHRTPKSPAPTATAKAALVLGDLENKTGEAAFDGTLRQSLAVVEGSIALLGNQYVLALRAKNCSSGDILDDEQVVANRKEEVIGSLGPLAGKLRTHIGESLATLQKPVPLEEVTTSSLDALQAYTTGWRLASYRGSVDHYQRAIAFDPQFAMAHATLGINYYNSGQTELAAEYSRKAYQLRQRASQPEKLYIDYNCDRNATGNLEKALRTLELWAHTYPQDARPSALAAGKVTLCTGRYEKSIQEAEIAIRLDPNLRHAYNSLTWRIFFWGGCHRPKTL
jgi:eukaryotic-like serine/threonine-protein kinase